MNDPTLVSDFPILTALNIPVLLIGPLLLAAMLAYIFRRWEQAITLMIGCYTGVMALVFINVDLNKTPLYKLPTSDSYIDMASSLEWLGFTLQLQSRTLPLIIATLLLATFALILATHIPQGRNFASATLILLAVYMIFYLSISGPTAPTLTAPLILAMISCGGVFALQTERLKRLEGPLRSLIPPTLAFPLFLVAALYIEVLSRNPQDVSSAQTAAQLLSVGLLLLLAPIPLHGALTITAHSAPPIAAALLIILYQLALLYLFGRILNLYGFIYREIPLGSWLTWAGAATALWGGIATAGTRHPGQLWGYSALHDWGLIIMILSSMSPSSRLWTIVIFLYILRSVSMLTAATGLAVLQQHAGGLEPERLSGLGSRLPWSSAAYLLGGLGLIGFPLSAGFAGHWSALQFVAANRSWQLASLVLLASGSAVFGYVRVASVLFAPLGNRMMGREGWISAIFAALMLLLSVLLAIMPQLLDIPIRRALAGFN